MKLANPPLVSILMTVYNREKYIAEAIDSVLASTYQNWELIIVDDRSTDSSVEIANRYEKADTRIKVFINEHNLGDYPNRNKAASYARGKYLKYLDSDDIIYPHGLSVMVNAMEKFPEAVIGIPDFKENGQNQLPYEISAYKAYNRHFFKAGLLYTGPTGAIYKSSFFKKIAGFNTEYGVASDMAFNLRCTLENSLVIFQRDLFWWRPHPGQEINKRQNEYEHLNNHINTYFLTHDNCPLNIGERQLALHLIRNVQSRKIIRLLLQFRFKAALYRMKNLNLNIYNILISIIPNKLFKYKYSI